MNHEKMKQIDVALSLNMTWVEIAQDFSEPKIASFRHSYVKYKMRYLAKQGKSITEISEDIGMGKYHLQKIASKENIIIDKPVGWGFNGGLRMTETHENESLFYGLPSEVKGTACGAWV